MCAISDEELKKHSYPYPQIPFSKHIYGLSSHTKFDSEDLPLFDSEAEWCWCDEMGSTSKGILLLSSSVNQANPLQCQYASFFWMSSFMALDSLQYFLNVIEKPHQMIADSKSHGTTEYLVRRERKVNACTITHQL